MAIKVITPPAAAIDIATLRLHLRTDAGAPDDSLILGYLAAAQELAQHYTGIAIGAQMLELALDAFPSGAIPLPVGPATTITSITYLDSAGALQTVSSSLYALDDYGRASTVGLAFNAAWPTSRAIANAVKVKYAAGSGTVPAAVLTSLMLMVGHFYENREEVAPADLREVPMGAKALLDTVRAWSF
jgi:uncharacterized phiE125 gp8 family phage protein